MIFDKIGRILSQASVTSIVGGTRAKSVLRDYLFERIQEADYDFPGCDWDHMSEDAKDLIRHLLEYDVKNLYSAANVILK